MLLPAACLFLRRYKSRTDDKQPISVSVGSVCLDTLQIVIAHTIYSRVTTPDRKIKPVEYELWFFSGQAYCVHVHVTPDRRGSLNLPQHIINVWDMDRPQNTRLSCLCDTPCRFYLSVPANVWNIKHHRSLPTTRFAFGHRKSVRVCSPNGIRSRAWLRISQERNVRRFSCAVRVTRTDHDTCALPIFCY